MKLATIIGLSVLTAMAMAGGFFRARRRHLYHYRHVLFLAMKVKGKVIHIYKVVYILTDDKDDISRTPPFHYLGRL